MKICRKLHLDIDKCPKELQEIINDEENLTHLFLDKNLEKAESLSFHPNDSRGTVVISREEFMRYLDAVGNSWEFVELY